MQGLLILHAVGTELGWLRHGFDGARILWWIIFLPGLKQDQFAGNGNTGRQDNIQTGFTVVGKGDSDLCPRYFSHPESG